MKFIDQLLSQQEFPLMKNFGLRFFKYLILAIIISYTIYKALSLMNLDTIDPFDSKRALMAFLMLKIMSAKSWGWFTFIVLIFSTLWGDWRNFRWQLFPKKKSNGNGDNENNLPR